jgi:gamma-glutamyltranspeptidase / glutathione hydrolase
MDRLAGVQLYDRLHVRSLGWKSGVLMRDFQRPGRSLAYGTRAMVATSHPNATLAALDVLKAGGNAVDAAVTAAAVLAVCEPQSTGIGGDCFALLHVPGVGIKGFNGSGRSPRGLDAEAVIASGSIEQHSPESVTIPGAIDAWEQLLAAHGTIGLDRALAPAIRYAEGGFVVTPRVADDWSHQGDLIARHEGARTLLTLSGRLPVEGEVMRFPALAATLQAIAGGGRSAFYEGAVAEDMVRELRALGGTHALNDFAVHRGEWVTPLSTSYPGFDGPLDICEIPPNGHGITALIILNILKHLPARGADPVGARRIHLLLEAARAAYAVRDTFVADPHSSSVPVDHMLSGALAKELAARINPGRRTPDLGPVPRPKKSDTVYLAVAEASGLAVSFINSTFSSFGSGIVTRKTGINLQNRGEGFSLQRGHPNVVAPGKRPLHTIIPGMAMENGAPRVVFGVMGGAYQPVGHAHVLTSMFEHGLDPQAAVDCPRAFFEDGCLSLEAGVPEAVARELSAMGHEIGRAQKPFGGSQMIVYDCKNGTLLGASDPRKDGFAAGL